MRLIARARSPLRECQPDGVAWFGSAASFSFVYCGAREKCRSLARRDCDGCDRDCDRGPTLVPRLRSRRFIFRAVRKASNDGGRAPESAARAAGIRLIPDPADAGRALMLICTLT